MLRVAEVADHVLRRPTPEAPRPASRTAAARVLDLQRQAGNQAVSRLLARQPIGLSPAVVYSDWATEIGVNAMDASVRRFLYEATHLSDRRFTLEDEFEAAIDIDAAYLTSQQDAANLSIWQKQLRSEFNAVKLAMAAAQPNWADVVRRLSTAYGRAMAIYALPMAPPQYDVSWKRQVRADGEIVMRNTGTRVEALFEVTPAGGVHAEKKNLNVSLRRHWWGGVDVMSVANPAGNSLMGPDLQLDAIQADVRDVAAKYIAHVSKRGYAGEFGADTPSGVHYHVNRLENQQPHCFPNRGAQTLVLSPAEYTAAVSLNLYSKAITHNRRSPVGLDQVRNHVRAADGILGKLKGIGVGFSETLVKQLT
jgi:hypothetical protein